jgi:amidase
VRGLEAIAGRPLGVDDLEPMNFALAHIGAKVGGAEYLDTVDWLHAWSRRTVSWWHDGGFDLLLSPVLNGLPPPLGWLTDPDEGTARFQRLLQYTSQFNVTGQPAISLPLHWTGHGLPVGVQLVAAYGREDVLLRVAAQLEAAHPWADRHPDLPI